MLTDEEAAAAQAEYDALPGVKPDGYSWTWIHEVESVTEWVRDKLNEWEGMKWLRVTKRDEDGTLWLEVWKDPPRKEAPFDPPYVAG